MSLDRSASSRTGAPSRTGALVASASSVLLASGLAVSLSVALRSFERETDNELDAIDPDQTAVTVWWAGDIAFRWAVISAAGSVCGVLGLLFHRSKLHRVFALTTAFDLLATVFLTLTLGLLTFSPSLSEPFGDFVCSSSYAASAEDLLSRSSDDERQPPSWTTAGLALWGAETCEDAWQSTMLRVLVGCVVTIALRAYGTWVTWEANVELREREIGWTAVPTVDPHDNDDEVDDYAGEKSILEKAVRRLSTSSSSSSSRRPTLTPLSLEEARSHRQSCDGRDEHDRRRRDGRRSQTLPTPVTQHRRSRSQTDHGAHWVVSPATSSSPSSRSSSRSSTPSRRSTSSEPRLVFVPFVLDSHGHAVYEPSSPTYAAAAPSSQPPSVTVASPVCQSDIVPPRRPKLRSDSRSVATPPSPPPPPYLTLPTSSDGRSSPPLNTCTKPSDEVANRHSWLASQI